MGIRTISPTTGYIFNEVERLTTGYIFNEIERLPDSCLLTTFNLNTKFQFLYEKDI